LPVSASFFSTPGTRCVNLQAGALVPATPSKELPMGVCEYDRRDDDISVGEVERIGF
jgi:hypothetical protein